jgi:hypothetical protein
MQSLWTWSGLFFGYRDGGDLWTHDGRHVGRFHGDEIYDPNGTYLGELRRRRRLITDLAKLAQQQRPFFPSVRRCGESRRAPLAALLFPPNHLDFSSP